MQMLGWMLLLANGLLPLAADHVCTSQPVGTYLCDPASDGTKYFICMGTLWPPQHLACPRGLLFDVKKIACDWPQSAQTCSSASQPSPATTTSPHPTTTTTTTTPPPPPPPVVTDTTTTTTTTTAAAAAAAASSTSTTSPGTVDIATLCLGMPDFTYMCDPATDGTSFIVCHGEKSFRKMCPAGIFFNQKASRCDWRANIEVMCVAGHTPVPPRSTTPAGPTTVTTTAPLPPGECSLQTCQLPDCRCPGSDIPGGLPAEEVPQMVMLTFDDRIGWDNYHYYPRLFWDREGGPLRNPNNCTTRATFFVSNDGNNMENVKRVWQHGHEIASHSLTHSNPAFWTPDQWTQEMLGMKNSLEATLGTNGSEVRGLRTPFLELGADRQFSMMEHRGGFTYDSSFISWGLQGSPYPHPIWPFTLNYPPNPDVCSQARCPQGSHPGVWEVPIVRQRNPQDELCSMTDSCRLPREVTPAQVTAFLRQNFLRHYLNNRAPFMVSLHTTWFANVPASLQGLMDFLAEISADPQVWQVTVTQMLDWVRHPVPLSRLGELASWGCKTA